MKKILSIITVMVLGLVLVACGPRVYGDVNVLTVDELREADPFTITFRIPFGTGIQASINEIVEDFELEWPNIDVEVEVVGGYTELKNSLVLDLQSYTAPTMAVGYPDHFAEYLIGDGLIPLDAFINSTNEGVGYSETELADFIEDYMVENRQFDEEGTYYGLPFNKSTEILIYNKKFFDEFELTVPKTWAQVESVSKQILDIVHTGQADELYDGFVLSEFIKTNPFVPFAWDSTSNFFITTTRQWGGTYTEGIDLETGTLLFDNAEAKAALTFLSGLANFERTAGNKTPLIQVPEYWEKTYASDPFKAVQAVMTVGSSAGISYNVGGRVTEVGVSTIPYFSEDNKLAIQQGTNVAIFAQSTDLERMAAWMLIKHFLEPENIAKFSMETSYFPQRSSVYELESYQSFLTNPPIQYIAHAQSINVAIQYEEEGFNFFVDPAWAGSSRVRDTVGTMMAQIFVTGKAIQAAINDAYSTLGVR